MTTLDIHINAGDKSLIVPWTKKGIEVALMFLDLLKEELVKQQRESSHD